MQEIVSKIFGKIFSKRIIKRPEKILILFFLSNPITILFNEEDDEKRGLKLVASDSSGY